MIDSLFRAIIEIVSKVSGSNELKAVNKEIEDMSARNQTIADLMNKTGLSANKLKMGMSGMGFSIDKNGAILDSFGRQTKLVSKDLSNIRKATHRFNMSLLGLMFGFMQLKMVIGGFLKSALTTYEKANGEQNAFRKETNKLIAAWEFFKYSIIDALAQSELFKMLVNWLFIIINKVNEFLAKNPKMKEWLSVIALFTYIAVSILFAVVAMGLFLNALKGFGIPASMSAILPILGKIALAILIVYLAYQALKTILDIVNISFGTNISVMSILLGLFNFFMIGLTVIIFLFKALGIIVAVTIAGIVALFYGLIGTLFFFRDVADIVWKTLANGLYSVFKKPIDWLINRLNDLIGIYNKIKTALGGKAIELFKPKNEFELFEVKSLEDTLKDNQFYQEANKMKVYMENLGNIGREDLAKLGEGMPTFKEVGNWFNPEITPATPAIPESTTKTPQIINDNRQVNLDMNIDMTGVEADVNELATQIKDQITQELNKSIGTTNI